MWVKESYDKEKAIEEVKDWQRDMNVKGWEERNTEDKLKQE